METRFKDIQKESFLEKRLLNVHGEEFVAVGGGFSVSDPGGANKKSVINQNGELLPESNFAMQQYYILKPEVGAAVVVNGEDISGGDVSGATLARTTLDYPRNLLYTLADDDSDTLEATFEVVGTDQFGVAATEEVIVDFDGSATEAGTQIFATITSIDITGVANEAANDTASVGVAIAADVASFGLPTDLRVIGDVKSINWIDAGVSKVQNINATSISLTQNAFQPEQTVAAADDYVIHYLVSRV